jgi:diacylglycerol kinase (ATP)
MRALLVHNPTAGSTRPSGDDLLALLDAAGFSTTYRSSKQIDFKAALAQPADIVIVAGGDGTVAKIVRNLPDRKTLVAILPIGTANNIARCLEIFGDAEALAKNLRGAPVKRLDIGVAHGPWGSRRFVESVGWGALAKAVDRSDPKLPKQQRIQRGREIFADHISRAKPEHFKFVADGEEVEGEFIFVEVLNLGVTGPRMLIGPSAHPGDQLLDIVYLTEQCRPAMLDWLKSDPDNGPAPIEARKVKKVTLTWAHGPLRIDDQVFDEPKLPSNIIIELEPEALRVLVPSLNSESSDNASPPPVTLEARPA